MKKTILLTIFSISFNFLVAQPFPKKQFQKDNNSLLWEISGNGLKKTSYLFGTFHLICKDDLPASSNLKKAISYCSSIYLEMDMDDPANTISALKEATMKDNKCLKDLLTDSGYLKIKNFFKDSLDFRLNMFEKMKPIFISSLLYPKMLDCKNFCSAEEILMQWARNEKKEIKGLETSSYQSSVIDNIPYQLQAISLMNTIDSFSFYKAEFNKMLSAYKTQQLKEIEKTFEDDLNQGGEKEMLLDNRNKDWVKKMKNILNEENIFLAVGAGHLIGENGLISLLRKEGYTLRAVKN